MSIEFDYGEQKLCPKCNGTLYRDQILKTCAQNLDIVIELVKIKCHKCDYTTTKYLQRYATYLDRCEYD